MSRRKGKKKNESSTRWLMVVIYPLALSVMLLGVVSFDWLADATESEPQGAESFSDRETDDIFEKLGINDMADESISQLADTIEVEKMETADGAGADSVTVTDADMDGCYYYSVLSESEKGEYLRLCSRIENTSSGEKVIFGNQEEADRIYHYVMGDHPEYFYVSGYSYGQTSEGTEIRPNYSYSADEITGLKAKNEGVADEVVNSMPGNLSEYEKIKYLYEWVISNTDYVLSAENSQEISSVFINHKSVCAGYSRAMQYLLQKCGMQAMYVTGNAAGSHAWLIVKADGQYYNLDVTWADSTNPEVPHPDYAYLCLSTDKISMTHTADTDIYPIPECTSMDDNFYLQEGLYVNDTDDDTLKELFDKSRLEHNGTVYLMASDAGVYSTLKDYLIDQGNVYRLYYGDSAQHNIRYSENDDLYTLSFYK